jgi:hypothetical protein
MGPWSDAPRMCASCSLPEAQHVGALAACEEIGQHREKRNRPGEMSRAPFCKTIFCIILENAAGKRWPDPRRIEPSGKAIDPATTRPEQRSEQEWLDLEQVAKVEVTSENPNLPIESALASGKGPGWRCIKTGTSCSYLPEPGI